MVIERLYCVGAKHERKLALPGRHVVLGPPVDAVCLGTYGAIRGHWHALSAAAVDVGGNEGSVSCVQEKPNARELACARERVGSW